MHRCICCRTAGNRSSMPSSACALWSVIRIARRLSSKSPRRMGTRDSRSSRQSAGLKNSPNTVVANQFGSQTTSAKGALPASSVLAFVSRLRMISPHCSAYSRSASREASFRFAMTSSSSIRTARRASVASCTSGFRRRICGKASNRGLQRVGIVRSRLPDFESLFIARQASWRRSKRFPADRQSFAEDASNAMGLGDAKFRCPARPASRPSLWRHITRRSWVTCLALSSADVPSKMFATTAT
eukprot:scaffold697_cov235-Pinguiococcus_pyrenoidosus.AAC.3